ncbi:isoprenylcysteine carboxylmethyltransferase family protein [Aquibium sp. LZ166]|uniref:Isoprenylcysteine carboxylmethyltransferase family protein n=1 Tax=Aquibium pacificus TaxID=3153579 RepID=A0ABV3SSC8_9HYPH
MVSDLLARQGNWLFRWRSYFLLGLAPLFLIALSKPEVVEVEFGSFFDSVFEGACIAFAFAGLAVRGFTVGYVPGGTSGRNTRGQLAETLNTTGLYSLTRNPLYLGNAVIYMAIAAFTQDVFVFVIMGLFLWLYLERIIAAEEAFLAEKFGKPYLAWASQTPVFLPRLTGWRAPVLPFSVRNVLRREYSGFFAIVASFFIIDQLHEYLTEHPEHIDLAWALTLAGGAVLYLFLRTLKKRTRLLDVAGR